MLTARHQPKSHPCASLSPQVQDEANSPAPFTELRFSNDGKQLLGVVDGRVYVLHAFEGHVVCKFATCKMQDSPPALEADFSPCSQYVVAGEEDTAQGCRAVAAVVDTVSLHCGYGSHAGRMCAPIV